MQSQFTQQERRAWEQWLALRTHIRTATAPEIAETENRKEARIKKLLSNFEAFCQYYFPHYCKSPFGYFHKDAARKIEKDRNIFAILEWPREHAKSVFVDVLLPLYLKAKGEFTGMILGSANYTKAAGLLGDVQAELMENQRYIADFGPQYSIGNWQDGSFSTIDGCGYWAFGRGQSPRGTRNAEKRPNYGVLDDLDDAEIVKNESRVLDAVDWVLGDFFGALSIKNSRLIVAGNRIHNKGILAYLVGDTTPEEPKRSGIWHSKVYAIERRKGKEGDITNGQPAWKENYTLAQINEKIEKMGSRIGRREFFHKHIVLGKVFKEEHIVWADLPDVRAYKNHLVTYCDPSFKDTKKSDYKAIILLGRYGKYYDIINAWVRQTTPRFMAAAHYDLADLAGDNNCTHWMESNFLQDLLLEEYEKEGISRGFQLNIRGDNRKKPDKIGRIENISPLFERGLVRFNNLYRNSYDMITLRDQLLGFPDEHDDGPDALEGAIEKINKLSRANHQNTRIGKYRHNSNRRG